MVDPSAPAVNAKSTRLFTPKSQFERATGHTFSLRRSSIVGRSEFRVRHSRATVRDVRRRGPPDKHLPWRAQPAGSPPCLPSGATTSALASHSTAVTGLMMYADSRSWPPIPVCGIDEVPDRGINAAPAAIGPVGGQFFTVGTAGLASRGLHTSRQRFIPALIHSGRGWCFTAPSRCKPDTAGLCA